MQKISVIIPTLNEEKYIDKLLSSLKDQTRLPNEIIVVDGGSTDKTQKIVKSIENVDLVVTVKGVGHQRKIGSELAKGDLLYFLDADVILHNRFIENTFKTFKDRDYSIACPVYHPINSTYPILFSFYFFNSIFYLSQKFIPSGAGMGILVKKSAVEKHGNFKPHLTYEDIEFIRRIGERERFGIIPEKLHVSDRRFRKYGTIKTFLLYLLLSVFIITKRFELANVIDYKFGDYSNN